ncbi:cupin domain-containing protein [Flavitalea flava]
MRPQLVKVCREPGHSFSIRQDQVPYVNTRWHLHPEVELIHFKKGEGTQFVGDSMKPFESGDLVLVGSNLPHQWRFEDKDNEEDPVEKINVRVCHFGENFWGKTFLELPENNPLKVLLEKSRRGIQIYGEVSPGYQKINFQSRTSLITVTIFAADVSGIAGSSIIRSPP